MMPQEARAYSPENHTKQAAEYPPETSFRARRHRLCHATYPQRDQWQEQVELPLNSQCPEWSIDGLVGGCGRIHEKKREEQQILPILWLQITWNGQYDE